MWNPKTILRRVLSRRFSLIQKLTILTGTVVILFMTLFAWININNLQSILLNNSVRDLDNMAASIIRMTRQQMLLDNRQQAYQMFNEATSRPGIERIRMINSKGIITHSTVRTEIGTKLDPQSVKCDLCHKKDKTLQLKLEERSRFFTLPDGRQVMGLSRAVRNELSCSTASCHAHGKEQKILGVVDIIVSLDPLKAELASYRNRIILLTVLLIILLGASITFFTLHLVNRPVNELLRHTSRLAQGDLECELLPTSNDELGELMWSFQQMTTSLRQARRDLEDWGHTLEDKVEERTAQIQQMQMQLVHTEKLASLGELVAGIAHEINNPLSGILIFSELVAKDKRLDPGLKTDLETISVEAKRCAGIVKGLLEFARDYQPSMTLCDINQVLVDSLRLVECQSVFQNVAILRQLDQQLPKIMADQNQLKQVFINIFINAGHAMQDLKRGELRITTRRNLPENSVTITIADSGCGMPADQLGKLFDPFFTTKGAGGGTGLGLSVSYGIIQAHGGSIKAESEEGKGMTFIINLPQNIPANGKNEPQKYLA